MAGNNKVEFAVNKEVVWNGETVRVEKVLGSGLTADVYRVNYQNHEAALKVMKPGMGQTVKAYFLSEHKNLKDIWSAWDQKFPEAEHATPQYFGGNTTAEQPFLIMELIRGKVLLDWIDKNGPLSERDALILMQQFGQLLVVLHEELEQCYADIKFDNLWLLERVDENAAPRMKVTDWNVLAPKTDEGVVRDLFFASLFLYRMLTGASPQYSGGQVGSRLEQAAAFASLSDGTQAFLRRSLHNNLSRRCVSAREWTDMVGQLAGWWNKDANDLNILASQLLDQAEKHVKEKSGQSGDEYADLTQQAALKYDQARSLLGISEKKGKGSAELWEVFDERVLKGAESTSSLESGMIALKGGWYEKALATFDQGADLSSLEPERLRRWYWLAHAAYEIGTTAFKQYQERAIAAVDALLAGETEQAFKFFDEINGKISPLPLGLRALGAEAKILKLVEQAQQSRQAGDYKTAAACYREAYDIWKPLPRAPKTAWADAVGDLEVLIRSVEVEQKTVGVARKKLNEALAAVQKVDYAGAGKCFREALEAAPENAETLKVLVHKAEEGIGLGRLDDSLKLLEQSLGMGGARAALKHVWVIASELKAIDSLSRQGQVEEAVGQAAAYRIAHQGEVDNLAFGGQTFRKIMDNLMKAAIDQNSLDSMDALIDLVRNVGGSAEKWVKELETQRNDFVSRRASQKGDRIKVLLDEAVRLSHDTEDALGSAKKAAEIADQLDGLLPPDYPQIAEIKKTTQGIRQHYQELLAEAEKSRQRNEQRIQEIARSLGDLEKELARREEKIAVLDENDPLDARILSEFRDHRVQLMGNILALLFELGRLAPADGTVQKKRKDYLSRLDRLNLMGWAQVSKAANQRLAFTKERMAEASKKFEAGAWQETRAYLNQLQDASISVEGYDELNQRVEKVREFLQDVQSFPALASAGAVTMPQRETPETGFWQKWQNKAVPAVYWNSDVLGKKAGDSTEKYFRVLQTSNSTTQDSLNALARLIQARWVELGIRRKQGSAGGEDKPVALDAVVNAAWKKTGWLEEGDDRQKLLALIDRLPQDADASLQAIFNAKNRVKLNRDRSEQNGRILKMAGLTLVGIGVVIVLIFVGALVLERISASSTAATAVPGGPSTAISTVPSLPEAQMVAAVVQQTQAAAVQQTKVADSVQQAQTAAAQQTKVADSVQQTKVAAAQTAADEAAKFKFLQEAGKVLPAIPGRLKDSAEVYVIDDKDAVFTPEKKDGNWKPNGPEAASGVGNSLVYMDTKPQGNVSVMWQMDKPLAADGLYEIFYCDTIFASSVAKPLPYAVSVDGQPQIPELISQDAWTQEFSQVNGGGEQTVDKWRSLGVYRLPAGKIASVNLDLTGYDIGTGEYVGIDAVMLARLPELGLMKKTSLAADVPADRLLFWLDKDSGALAANFPERWSTVAENPDNWNGALTLDLASSPSFAPLLTWTVPYKLPPGQYEVDIVIPGEATSKMNLNFTLDNKAIKDEDLSGGKLPSMQSIDAPTGGRGMIKQLAIFKVKATAGSIVKVELSAVRFVTKGTLAGSAILVLKAAPPAPTPIPFPPPQVETPTTQPTLQQSGPPPINK